jgi:hypothetical protein
MLTIKLEGIDLMRKLDVLPESLQGPAMQAAINKTADKAQAEVNRAIRDEYAVNASEVRNAITMRKARKGDLQAVIRVFGSANKRGRSLNMIHFLAAMQAAGLAVKTRGAVGVKRKDISALGKQLGFLIKKGGGLKKIQGAFVGNKGRTVFMREGKGRLPIKPVQVIGFSQMFSSRKISDRVMAKIRADLPVEVDRAIKAQLARFGR